MEKDQMFSVAELEVRGSHLSMDTTMHFLASVDSSTKVNQCNLNSAQLTECSRVVHPDSHGWILNQFFGGSEIFSI